MNNLNLPNLHDKNVQVSELEIGQNPFDVFLEKNFNCEYTRRFLKRNSTFKKVESLLKKWIFKVNTNLTLSQSKIKGFWSTVDGEACPKTFEQSLFKRDVSIFKESDAMIHGQIFEHMATGQTNYTNEVPDYSKIELKNGKLSKIGQVIEVQAENWKSFANQYKKIETGRQLHYRTNDYIITSLPDVITEKNIIDLKLGDPEGTFGGFGWHDNKLPKQEKLLLQAKVNQFIWLKNIGQKIPFIFYIASKSGINAKARNIIFKDFDGVMAETEQLIKDTYYGIKFLVDNKLFKPMPEIKFCNFCNVKNCKKKTGIAVVRDILI